jgi:DNA processing protein
MRELKKLPKSLTKLKKPPKTLYYEGDINLLDKKLISIVGTRRPSLYTKEMTAILAKKFSQIGYVVVSGAAMGVDAIAHRGAFSNTIAVMANSLDIIYPAVNRSLINEMKNRSLILSEYPQTTKATKYSFVLRNRIVVALGECLIITEADLNSGSLRSFEYAKELGKDIYVLSHRVGESLGTQELIKDGYAKVITDIDEFIARFGEVLEDDDELNFFDTPKSLQEAIDKFGDRVYEFELEGLVEIKNLRVKRV